MLSLGCFDQNQFSKDAYDIGRTNILEHHINIKPGTKPIKQQPYRLPMAKRRDAENEIKRMSECDLIEPSTSPWSSPAIIVQKKNGGIRFCIDYRRLNKVTVPDSMPMSQYNVGYPLERCALDCLGPLPTSNNAKYLLVVSCYFTKWLQVIPLESIDAKTVATKLIERFISVLGVPVSLHSDQGSNFESSVFQEVCALLGIEKTRTTPGRPQSDGMVERACRSIQAMLSAYVSQNQKDWATYIPMLVLAYNSSVHDTTRCTPASLMLGRQLRLPIDLALGIPETRQSTCETDYAYLLEKQLVHIHDIARKHIKISSDGMKRFYDRNKNFKRVCCW